MIFRYRNTAAILAFLSAIAALFGSGLTPNYVLTPRDNYYSFRGIAGDGWVEDGASIRLNKLASRGNRLELKFKTGRPGTSEAAQISPIVCGQSREPFAVDTNAPVAISLRGDCEPREVRLDVLNPVRVASGDPRQLGAQLISARVTSRLGVPLLEPLFLLEVFGAIYALTLVYLVLFQRFGARLCAFVIPPLSFYLLKQHSFPSLWNLYHLWLLSIALGLGALLFGSEHFRRLFRRSASEDISAGLALTALAVIVSAGAALRLYGLSFGLPNNYHPDEVPKVNAIMRMVDHGDLNPRYFLHPSLLLYSTYGMNKLFHLFGMDGSFRETAFLAGRTVSMLAGTFSIVLTYIIGVSLYSRMVGVIAAGLLAGFPLHVTCSRYLKEDSLLLFFILACVACVVWAVRRDRPWLLLLAGLMAGFSASTKYSGMLTAAIVVGAPWFKSRNFAPDWRFLKAALPALLLVPCAFLAATPYAILDSAKFLKDFGSEQNHMVRGHTVAIDAWSQLWMYHYSRSLIPGVSWPVAVFATVAVGALLWRRRVEDLMLVGLVVMFYLPAEWVKAKPAPQPERYIFPCLPFLAIAAAELMRVLAQSRAQLVVPVLAFVLFFVPARRAAEISSEIKEDTRSQMAAWMIQNLPANSKVYLDWKPYSPRFWNNEFDVSYILRAKIIPKLDIRALRESGQDYLVLSSLFYGRYFTEPKSDVLARQRFRELFQRVPVVKEFAPRHGTYGFHNPVVTLFSLKEEDFERLDREIAMKKAGEIDRTSNEMRASFRWK